MAINSLLLCVFFLIAVSAGEGQRDTPKK